MRVVLFSEENCMSNDSTFSQSDVKKALKDIRISNMNKLIFGHIDSLRNKFDLLSEQVKGFIDILMVSETKLDDSFAEGQFLMKGFHSLFRFDRNRNGGGIIFFKRFFSFSNLHTRKINQNIQYMK